MVSTRLGTDDDGRPVLVKEGDPEALAREAAVLAAARHPGVVEVASEAPGRLVLRWIGSRTLADLRPPVEQAARLAAALAATVADLHALGIRHGRIVPGRVVLDVRGRPVLCGFGGAALAGEPGPSPADDVAGVGVVLRCLAGADAELEPIPEQRFVRRRSWPGALRRALLTVADQATDDDPARRPTARSLAATLADLVPEPDDRALRPSPRARGVHAATPAEPAPASPPPGERDAPPRRRPPVLVGAAAAAALVAFLAMSAADGASVPAALDQPPPEPSPGTGDELRMVACDPVAGTAVDHDGDGCPSTVVVGPGVVEVDGTRYGVGEPGDVLAVGDWDCDGVGTVAAVRPGTGEVFVFDRWASRSEDAVAGAVTTVPGASTVRADDPDGDGCPRLVVVDVDGETTEVTA